MSLYTFLQYLKYRRKAMGRHGTHSPFIYDLVENCIQQRGEEPLLPYLLSYLKDWQVHQLKDGGHLQEIITENVTNAGKLLIIVPSIYKSEKDTLQWRELSANSQVDYSIDLFEFGLLLINPNFKEKQHFILKS